MTFNCNTEKGVKDVLQIVGDLSVYDDADGMVKYMTDDVESFTIGRDPIYGRKGKCI